MISVSIARRYARALLDLSTRANVQDQVGQALERFAGLLRDSADLRLVMEDPAIPVASRQAVLAKILSAIEAPTDLGNMLKLMVDRSRMGYVPAIARSYRDLLDALAGRVRARVTSAVALDGEAAQRLQTALAKLTPGTVSVETAVEPAILGGLIAQIGSTVYDGSLKNQLETLGNRLRA